MHIYICGKGRGLLCIIYIYIYIYASHAESVKEIKDLDGIKFSYLRQLLVIIILLNITI